ncbi:MAG: signal recognition particle receptor subunit alpha, partial [Myxococcales bacterium]|nr:signal recognition particle receptor subunit alpha [Myxococcales bacterium]
MSPAVIAIVAILGAVLIGAVIYAVTRRGQELPPGAEPRMLEPEAPERPEPVTPVEGPTPAKPKAVPAPVAKPAESPAQREQRERYLKGLAQTRGGFVARLSRLFRGRPQVSEDLKDEVETVLFTADIGVRTAQKMIELVSDVLDRSTVADPDAVWSVIRKASLEILDVPAPPLDYDPTPGPYVLLMIGVNGVGKTTTLGKLAAMHKAAGRKVL